MHLLAQHLLTTPALTQLFKLYRDFHTRLEWVQVQSQGPNAAELADYDRYILWICPIQS